MRIQLYRGNSQTTCRDNPEGSPSTLREAGGYGPRRDYGYWDETEGAKLFILYFHMHEIVGKHEAALSDQVRSIILGSLLGDGSLKLHSGYVNARFSFRHSEAQKEYFFWKARELAEISADSSVFHQKKDGFGTNDKLRYQSRALPALTELYQLTHKRGRFEIRRHWLNLLTPKSLAIWWCDDGSIIGNGRKGVLCTDGFDKQSVERLARYLQVVWHIDTHVGAVNRQRRYGAKEYYRLWFGTEELKKFLRIILPHIPVASMLAKTILLYRDPQIQQRWISEVTALSQYSREEVENAFDEKRTRWKKTLQKMI